MRPPTNLLDLTVDAPMPNSSLVPYPNAFPLFVPVAVVQHAPSDRVVVVCDTESWSGSHAVLYDAAGLELVASCHADLPSPGRCAAIHPTEPWVAIGTGSYDGGFYFEGSILFWNHETGATWHLPQGRVSWIAHVAFSQDGNDLYFLTTPFSEASDEELVPGVVRDWKRESRRTEFRGSVAAEAGPSLALPPPIDDEPSMLDPRMDAEAVCRAIARAMGRPYVTINRSAEDHPEPIPPLMSSYAPLPTTVGDDSFVEYVLKRSMGSIVIVLCNGNFAGYGERDQGSLARLYSRFERPIHMVNIPYGYCVAAYFIDVRERDHARPFAAIFAEGLFVAIDSCVSKDLLDRALAVMSIPARPGAAEGAIEAFKRFHARRKAEEVWW